MNLRHWLIGIFAVTVCGIVFAEGDTPRPITLHFPDRQVTLNFDRHPELIEEFPQHYLIVEDQRIPISLKRTLPEESLIPIETEFQKQVSIDTVRSFLIEDGILLPADTPPVLISFPEGEESDEETEEERATKPTFSEHPQWGYAVRFQRLEQLLNHALDFGQTDVRVPARRVFSKVEIPLELHNKGVKEIIALGESNFTGSSRFRRTNIAAGAKKFNGIIIPQGEVFSFNDILESVSLKDGFVKELVIKGDKTEKEPGGGLCQVSTTAFRAAFSGGFPIVKRRAHSYSVPYYTPFGLDATIYLGGQDFQFQNDTPGDVLIQTFIEEDNLYFAFYGTRDDRHVIADGPFISHRKPAPAQEIFETDELPEGEEQVVSDAHAGFRAEWIRRVWKDGEAFANSFVSYYRPWPKQILRGTRNSESGSRN